MEEDAIKFKLLLIGGSAGSLEVLIKMLPLLQPVTTLSIVIVLHRKSGEDTTLEHLISLKTTIPVSEVEDKTPLLPGFLYIAPADYHLLFEKDGTLALDASEKINFSRPSIDAAFESAASVYGPAASALLLSGANNDGTSGLQAIKNSGGGVFIQEPKSAEMPYMPEYALGHVADVRVVAPAEMPNMVAALDSGLTP